MKHYIAWLTISIFCLVSGWQAQAQNLIIDADIQRLESQINQKNLRMTEVSGWIILIVAEKDRRKMDRVLGSFYYTFPEYKPFSEWIFDDPYYKILTGAFLNKVHSAKVLAKIRKQFPGAFEVSARLPMSEIVEFRRISLQ